MIALVAVLKIKPGMEGKVAQASLKMAEAVSKNEKECLLYEPYIPLEESGELYILEKYTSIEALETHRHTNHYLEFKEAVKDSVEGPTQVTLLKSVNKKTI
ncbi:MAG: putative quinol monooxygenase [Bacillota bacterium]|nr:antibiotic biosynthesis monooxygenase [Bacillota bacterium]MDW7728962.1 putative quinol monooxygenase [Bacillota bacterium]